MVINNFNRNEFGEIIVYIDSEVAGSVKESVLKEKFPEIEKESIKNDDYEAILNRSTERWKLHFQHWKAQGLLN